MSTTPASIAQHHRGARHPYIFEELLGLSRVEFHPATCAETSFQRGAKKCHSKLTNGNGIKKENGIVNEMCEIGFNPFKQLFEESKVKDVLRWPKALNIGPGFINNGNYCYLNAALQCLLSIPALNQLVSHQSLNNDTSQRSDYQNNNSYSRTNAVEMFRTLIMMTNNAINQNIKVVSISHIVRNLSLIGKKFSAGRQEDSHEFLRLFIDNMACTMLKKHGIKESNHDRNCETTMIHRVFGGYFRNRLQCHDCGFSRNSFDLYMDISLDICRGDTNIYEMLEKFNSKEVLDDDNKWQCDRCNNKVRADKQMSIHTASYTLVIHLKRFGYGGFTRKIDRNLKYPEILNLMVTGPEKKVQYELTGVLVHEGNSPRFGHYFSFVRGSNNCWYKFDDENRKMVSLSTVLEQQAYMLFYARIPQEKKLPEKISLKQSVRLRKETSSETISQINGKKRNIEHVKQYGELESSLKLVDSTDSESEKSTIVGKRQRIELAVDQLKQENIKNYCDSELINAPLLSPVNTNRLPPAKKTYSVTASFGKNCTANGKQNGTPDEEMKKLGNIELADCTSTDERNNEGLNSNCKGNIEIIPETHNLHDHIRKVKKHKKKKHRRKDKIKMVAEIQCQKSFENGNIDSVQGKIDDNNINLPQKEEIVSDIATNDLNHAKKGGSLNGHNSFPHVDTVSHNDAKNVPLSRKEETVSVTGKKASIPWVVAHKSWSTSDPHGVEKWGNSEGFENGIAYEKKIYVQSKIEKDLAREAMNLIRKRRPTEWDSALDMGRIKKIKKAKAPMNEETNAAFQREQLRKQQRQRYRN